MILSTPALVVKPLAHPYLHSPTKTGTLRSSELLKILPGLIRHWFFKRKVFTPKRLANKIYEHLSRMGTLPNEFYQTILKMARSHFKWFREENSMRIEDTQALQSAGMQRYIKQYYLKQTSRPIYKSSHEKLKNIIDGLVRFLSDKEGDIPIATSVFRRLGAHASSNSKALLNYLTIKEALQEAGILVVKNDGYFKTGECRVYAFDGEKAMQYVEDDDFVEIKKPKCAVVQDDEEFESEVLKAKVTVTGAEVNAFAAALEAKLRYYNQNRFIKLLPLAKRGSYKKYILGAAICKHQDFDVDRFIEAQFFYHNAWKDEAPDIKYITSVMSKWSSIGRYIDYCNRFKNDINPEDQSKDNVERAYKADRNKNLLKSSEKDEIERINGKRLYNDLLDRGLTKDYIFKDLGFPLAPIRALPLGFLKSRPEWLVLLADKHWGEKVNKLFWESEDAKRIDL